MQEWYHLNDNTRPNELGGFENQSFADFKNDAFTETLETDIATTVTLYDHDLDEISSVKCIIQGNTPDTQLSSMERIGLFHIGTVKAGMYVLFEGVYWLITGYPGSNGIYEKATLSICQYMLKWQLADGTIKERPVNLASASKYDVGETTIDALVLPSNNFTMLISYDESAMELEDKRVFIDRNTTLPKKVFKMTRNDDVLYDYGDELHGSILSFIVDRNELNQVTDNQELGICDYFESSNDEKILDLNVIISGGSTLKCGRSKTWTVSFNDSNDENITNYDFAWNVMADFDLEQSIFGNTIQLYTDDESLIESSFLIQVTTNESVVGEIEVEIVDMM